jgi:GNAT superfamily N-acetyltransferase
MAPTPDVKLARSDTDILRLFPVIAVLRPHIASAEEFLARARRQQAESGWRLIYVDDGGEPVACAGFRISEWLAWGKALYVDDLIALESHRGQGFAESLMRWMEALAIREGCAELHLDSGTYRLAAHRFYHRLRLAITSFHFSRTTGPPR